MKWIALFSQTGSEIVNLANIFGRKPNFILTNNVSEGKYKFHPGIIKLNSILMTGSHDIIMNYLRNQTFYQPHETLITLHGYLRIIPPDICEMYSIYNGHPGSIRMYPELKGKDPQVRTWNDRERYPIIGSVVHKVTPRVDEGDIIIEENTINRANSVDETFNILKETSLKAWTKFMQGKLN